MTLEEEVFKIFEENNHRITHSLIMEIADDIIDSLLPMVVQTKEEHESLKTRLHNAFSLQLKANLEEKKKQVEKSLKDADKS